MNNKTSGAAKARKNAIASLERKLSALDARVTRAMPLHMASAKEAPILEMRRIGLMAADGTPDILNVWVEDELVLRQGVRTGQSRPRPAGEVITLTVEAVGNPRQIIRIGVTNTNFSAFVDRIPDGQTHYEGASQFVVKGGLP